MLLKNQNTHHPSFEEVIAAAQPGVSPEIRSSLKRRLQTIFSSDEVMQGAVSFLEDHNYDFDALYEFLDMPLSLSNSTNNASAKNNLKLFWSIAASIIILFSVVLFIFHKNRPEKEMASSAFYEPGLPVFASIQADKDFHELMSAYRANDAKTGLKYYSKLIGKNPHNDTLNYFGGWLYFNNKQPDSAAIAFGKALKTTQGTYSYKARYMEAIAYYLSGQKTTAKKLLNK